MLLAAGSLGAASGADVSLADISASSGIDLVNVSGGPAKDYIVDANGNGAALFDYDNDGDLDALLVNGSTRERLPGGGDPMVAFYRNDGTGRFTDVTAASGFSRTGSRAAEPLSGDEGNQREKRNSSDAPGQRRVAR